MDWNALKNVLAIADTGSLSVAAKQLGVNHSTVYRRLQAYEQEIGVKLFELVNNRYELTLVGEEVVEQGREIWSRFEDIERHIVGKAYLPKGTVRITAPNNLAMRYIPQALKAFSLQYPDIQIELLSGNSEVNMNSRIADIAVRATSNPPAHLIGRKVADIPWGIFASPEYIDRYGVIDNLDALDEHRLIGGTGQMLSLPAFSWLEKHFSTQIVLRADELTVMSYFAETSQGMAFLPLDQVRKGLNTIAEFGPGEKSQIWLLTHPDLRQTERVRLVMRCLTDFFLAEPFSFNFQSNSMRN